MESGNFGHRYCQIYMSKVSFQAMHRYCAYVLGYHHKAGISMFDLVCDALAKDGRPRPADIGHSQWCDKNATHIQMTAKKASPATKKDKQKTRRKKARFDKVANDSFLNTYEWRKVRMEALKKYGPKCMCCGATPATGAVMNVDHIKPRKLFPEMALELSNLQILCHECNHGKGNWDQSDWRNR